MPQTKSQPKNWQKVKLGEVVSINPDSVGKDFTFEQILYTDISSVGTGISDAPTEIPLSDAPSRARRLVKDGDTILSTVRPNRRSFLYLKEPEENRVVSTGFAVLRAGDKIDSRFLYYLVSNQPFTDYLTLHAKGAAYPAIDEDIIANADVVLPELNDQKQIADVLSTYDDLIENNTKRIKVLEEMAQAIYKEWFVYFRFPGHEKVKMIDSKTEFGKIPEGWKIKNLGQVSENYDSKRRPISKMKREEIRGDIPYYGAAKIIDYVNNHIFDGKYLLMAEDGSVITKSGNPVLQFVNEKFWANNHTHILRGREVTTEYLYLSLIQFPIQGYITGVAQPKINQDNLNRIPILVPENEIAQKFDGLVESTFEDAWKLKEIVIKLSKARDLLLPKLVNGEIEVR